MPQWVVDLVGESLAPIVWVAIAAAIVIILAMLMIVLARKAFGGALANRAKGRAPRLAVMDVASIDEKRKLVLVRRDEVEHLLLIGGHNDLLLEGSILRVPATARMRAEPVLRLDDDADDFEDADRRQRPPAGQNGSQAPAVAAAPAAKPQASPAARGTMPMVDESIPDMVAPVAPPPVRVGANGLSPVSAPPAFVPAALGPGQASQGPMVQQPVPRPAAQAQAQRPSAEPVVAAPGGEAARRQAGQVRAEDNRAPAPHVRAEPAMPAAGSSPSGSMRAGERVVAGPAAPRKEPQFAAPAETTAPAPRPAQPTQSAPPVQPARPPQPVQPRSMATPVYPAAPAPSVEALSAKPPMPAMPPVTPLAPQPRNAAPSASLQQPSRPNGGEAPVSGSPTGGMKMASKTDAVGPPVAAEMQRQEPRNGTSSPPRPAVERAPEPAVERAPDASVAPPDPATLAPKQPLSVRSFATVIQNRQTPLVPAPPSLPVQASRRDPEFSAPPRTAPTPETDDYPDLEDFLTSELDLDFSAEPATSDVPAVTVTPAPMPAIAAPPAPAQRPEPKAESVAQPKAPEPEARPAPARQEAEPPARPLTLEEEMERLLGDFSLATSDRKRN